MTTLPTIILSGSIAIDRIMNFEGSFKELIKPDKIHALSVSVLINKLKDSPGGTAANIAYNLGLLHDNPIIVGSMGKDSLDYKNALTQQGIVTDYIHISDLPTASFTVLTDTDNNQVGGFYPGAMSESSQISLQPWSTSNVLVVLSANDPVTMRKHVEECTTYQLPFMYDVGQQVSNLDASDLQIGIENSTILIVNDYELSVLAEKTGTTEAHIKQIVPIVITTLGADGSRIEGKKLPTNITVIAVPTSDMADPTGAGDAYRAGFLYGYRRSYDLKTCAQLGSVIASFAIKSHGTQNHSFSLDQLQTVYQQTYGELCPIKITK